MRSLLDEARQGAANGVRPGRGKTGSFAFPDVATVREPAAAFGNTGSEGAIAIDSKEQSPADQLFAEVKRLVLDLLDEPRGRDEIAAALSVGQGQADQWLKRMVQEEIIEKHTKPRVSYARPANLFHTE